VNQECGREDGHAEQFSTDFEKRKTVSGSGLYAFSTTTLTGLR
jgi:hypothetical protein